MRLLRWSLQVLAQLTIVVTNREGYDLTMASLFQSFICSTLIFEAIFKIKLSACQALPPTAFVARGARLVIQLNGLILTRLGQCCYRCTIIQMKLFLDSSIREGMGRLWETTLNQGIRAQILPVVAFVAHAKPLNHQCLVCKVGVVE